MESSVQFPSKRTASFTLMIISKSVEQIKQKLKERNRSSVEGSDLFVFKELCTHEDSKIRGIACKTIIGLVKSNTFPQPEALSWFIAILQSNFGNNHDGIICAISDLLLLNEDAKHYSGFSIQQHPFVLALKQNEKNWSVIEFQLDFIFQRQITGNFQGPFSFVIPVFQYILWFKCTVSALCRRAAWRCLIKNFRPENFNFLLETIAWFSTDDRYSTLDVCHFLSQYNDELCEIMKRNNASDTLCVYYAYTSCRLAEYGYDPTRVLQLTQRLLREYPVSVNVVLALFARELTRCPVEFLNAFLMCCVDLIESNEYTCAATEWLIISAILPWLLHPFSSTEDVHKSTEILFHVVRQRQKCDRDRNAKSSSSLISDENFIRVITSEEEMYWAFVIACSLEESNHAEFLDRIGQTKFRVEEVARCPLLHLSVSAILLSSSENEFEIQNKASDILINLNAEFYLPHILYLLAQAPSSKLQLKLLHSLPLTAIEKENVCPVLRSIDSFFLCGKQVLTDLSIKLYLTLWKVEERCYSYLHDRLLEYEVSPTENVWQRDVILTSAIQDICALKPEKYGQEWISILNEIIKRWHKKKDGSLPSTLALDAILHLCRAEILKVNSIYEVLSERLFDDDHVQLLKKFHTLIGYMFETTKKEAFDQFKDVVLHAVSNMWLVISSSAHDELIFSALNALSKFDKNEMPLKVIPNTYQKQAKLPQEYTLKKSEKEIAELKDQLPYVPGNVWIRFLQSVQPQIKPKVCEMLMCWLKEEVDNFPRSLYGSIRGEPKDLKILHDRCLFKALIDYLKSNAKRSNSLNEEDLEMSVMCLKLLNGNLSKTLPLFNWTFLLPLIHAERPVLSEQIIFLFSKQCSTSSSARVSIEDYLKNFPVTKNVDGVKVVLNVLTDLCRGVSTVVLKSFLELVENYVSAKSDEALLPFVLDRYAEALRSSDIDGNNRICVSECVKRFWEKTSYDDAAFVSLLNAAVELPSTYVDCLCSLDEDQSSSDRVCKIVELQCAMAMKSSRENPFNWLQKSIEITALFPEKREFYFKCSLPVIKRYRLHSSCWPWLLQFIGYIHLSLDKLSDSGINFVYDTLIFTIVNMSVFQPFATARFTFEGYLRFFPQALNSVVVDKESSQIIDWLSRVTKSPKLDRRYKTLFSYALVSLKNNEYLSKVSIRSKIL